MKKVLITIVAMSLLLLSPGAYAQSNQMPAGHPPVAQPLVPEGDFALKMAAALKLGTPESEAQAEDILISVGIAPRNGWIADYPVTPDIIGELQNAVAAAADSGKLPMEKDEALNAFQNLIDESGLAVLPGSIGQYAESQLQPDAAAINDYYDEQGPPVVTYYPPPWDYYYMYAWVPYPFWWGGFFFSGFFCLHDFHRVVFVGHRRCVVSNHFFDHKTNRVFTIDPARRRTGETFRTAGISRNRRFNTTEARRSATSILERSREQVLRNRGNNTSTLSGRGETGTASRSTTGRTTNQPGKIERNFQGPSTGETRVFSGPNRSNGKSFSAPSTGSRSSGPSESSGKSFSAPPSSGSNFSCVNCHGGSSSFRRGGGGSSPRGFSGSGFSGGFSGGRGRGGRGR
jgi:hypothetical protein